MAIQGHQFWYRLKNHMRLLISERTYLLSCTVFKLRLIMSNFHQRQEALHFNALAGSDFL